MNQTSPPSIDLPRSTDRADDAPTAPIILPARRGISPAWLIPLAVAIFAGILAYQAAASRGPRILVRFQNGSGLQPGDPVTYRGVRVGKVREITISTGKGATHPVNVEIDLTRDASGIAMEGAAFWIVRPEVSLTKVSGLETLIGPRYIAAEPPAPPGEGQPRPASATVFVGLDRPPTSRVAGIPTPDLDLRLRAPRLGSVREGAPVTYRELPVGTVTSIALSEDGRRIDIAVRIQGEYAHLVRANTRFWNASGIGVDLGLVGGLKLKAESLQTVLAGGIAFATPTAAGKRVEPGHQFDLELDAADDYLKWSPNLTASEAPQDSAADATTAPKGRRGL